MNYYQSYYTDIGVKRRTNQDSLALLKAETEFGHVMLAVLCDGMGGHALGELASKTCVSLFVEWFKKRLPIALYDDDGYKQRIRDEWKYLVKTANESLADYGDKWNVKLGCTLTAALFIADDLFIAHIGDSRCYEIRQDCVVQLTHDHSVVAAVERGEMKLAPNAPLPGRNVLTQSVGTRHGVRMDYIYKKITADATYVICSDGFWHCVTEEELIQYYASTVIDSNSTLQNHLRLLVDEVKLRGEKDNISAIAVLPNKQKTER